MRRSASGSSPRLRGTVHPPRPYRFDRRFIPAPAGNGGAHRRCPVPASVHPRACGERFLQIRQRLFGFGSSPRLRGTAGPARPGHRQRRFIPAPAGNGYLLSFPLPEQPVHPRACGERFLSSREYVLPSGSSPRLRGTGCRRDNNQRQHRFIPAPAGNGSVPPSRPHVSAVHPRACGERTVSPWRAEAEDGSSPRLRGTGARPDVRGGDRRFIPAPAGNGLIVMSLI